MIFFIGNHPAGILFIRTIRKIISITKVSNSFPWAPKYYERLQSKHRNNWGALIPQIAFVLFLCDAVWDKVPIGRIAAQANVAYPEDFFTWVNGKKVPDLELIHLILRQASTGDWGYSVGNWETGWRLTKKGFRFAKSVERRL